MRDKADFNQMNCPRKGTQLIAAGGTHRISQKKLADPVGVEQKRLGVCPLQGHFGGGGDLGRVAPAAINCGPFQGLYRIFNF